MKTSQENSKSESKNKMKVSFSAVEAMERTTDSIETSLLNGQNGH